VKYLKFIILLFSITLLWQDIAFAADVHVRGYYRNDGTYVRPHMRSSPDGNVFNNWSTKGNVNPYTGKTGTKDPYKLLEKKGGVSAYPPNLNQIPPAKKNNQEFQVPNNAYVSGNVWYCNSGFKRNGNKCNVASNDKSLAGSINSPKAAIPSYSYSGGGYSSYDYDVSGYDSEGNYVYGDANADGSRDVDGYIYSEDGDSKSFSGEWVGKGEIEGYDEDGNNLSLEVN